MSSPDNANGTEDKNVPRDGPEGGDLDSSHQAQENSQENADTAAGVKMKDNEDDSATETPVAKDNSTEVKETFATDDSQTRASPPEAGVVENHVRETTLSSSKSGEDQTTTSETDSTNVGEHVDKNQGPTPEGTEKAKVSETDGQQSSTAYESKGEEKENTPVDTDGGKSTEEKSTTEVDKERVATIERTDSAAPCDEVDKTAQTTDETGKETKLENLKEVANTGEDPVKQEEVVKKETEQSKDHEDAEQAISLTISETISEHLDSARGEGHVEKLERPSGEQGTNIEGQAEEGKKDTKAVTSETTTAKEADSQHESLENTKDKETTERTEGDSDDRKVTSEPDTSTSSEAKVDVQPEAKADGQPEAKADGQPADGQQEAKADGQPEAKADGQPEAKADGQPEAKADGQPEAKADSQPEESQRPRTGENEETQQTVEPEKPLTPTTVGSDELANVADDQSRPQTGEANNLLSPSQSWTNDGSVPIPAQSVSPRLESGLDTALPDDPQTGRAESAMTDSSFFSVTPFEMRPYVPTPTPDIIQDYKIPTPEVPTTPALSEGMSRQLRRSSELLSSRESERAALDSQDAKRFDLTGEGIDEEEEEVEITEEKHNVSPEPSEVFTTAVSEETIQEAMGRQHQQVGEGVLGMWGHLAKEPFGDVIGTKSLEHYYRGIQCAKDGKFEEALVAFSKAINLRPQDADSYVQRGEIYLWMCDFQSAILNYKKACTIRINSSELYSRLAFIYYFQGQTFFDQQLYAEALESFTRAAEIRPDVIGYHTRSVACLAALHRYGECLALVNQRLEEERDNADLYVMRARLHELFRNSMVELRRTAPRLSKLHGTPELSQCQLINAAKGQHSTLCYYDVKDALALDPDQPEAQAMFAKLEKKAENYHNHACQLSINGKSNEALQKISMAIETNPQSQSSMLGATHRRLGDFNSAIDDYLLALDKTDHNEQDPTYMEGQRQLLLTYNDFAVECFQKGFYDEAIILLNKAIKGEKREKGLYINRGDCFFRQGDLHFALADYHQALELDPEDWAVRSRIAVVHSEFGVLDYEERNYQESETRFSLAIQNNPKVARFYVYRARARYMMENIRGAREDILMSLHLDPSSDEILSILSRLFPGKSVGEVMKSKAAKAAKLTLDQMLYMAAAPSHRLPPVDRSQSAPELSLAVDSSADTTDKGIQVSEEPYMSKDTPKRKKTLVKGPFSGSKVKRTPILPDLKMCMEERDFHMQIAKGKKKITVGLKKVLKERKTLKYKGARLRRLPPPTRTKSAESNEPSISQWRNIQPKVGLGLLDG
ncbi:Tetratricopeptide repeat protein 16 [Branchiostoma belcheri]|nr:Tetratricopeptide repeat protein 16 [Branchiostoma belcheri]